MKAIPVIFKFFFAGFFAYLFLFTLDLKITLFDAYDYLDMAKYNAGFHTWRPMAEFLRPPLLPALLTPFLYLRHFGVSYETIFTIAHIFSLMMSSGFILASYYLFRKGLRPEFAALGAFLLMIQPGFVAHSFLTMADIPAGLLMIFSIFIYLRCRKTQSGGQLALLCFVTALGVAMKYPMVLAPMVFISARMAMSIMEGTNWKQIAADRFYWILGLLSGAMYVAISVTALLPVHGWTWENAVRAVRPYLDHIPSVKGSEESMTANASFLFAQMTAPLFLLMCVGLALVWRRKSEFNIVMFMWFAVFLLIASVIGAHYEYRYLFPLVPACYFFCAFGMQEVFDYLKRRWSAEKFYPLAASIIFIFLMALPALGFVREIKSLNSGFYESDFQRQAARASAKGGKLYWFGALYAMYQKDAPFHREDPYYKIYHYWLNAIYFYTDKRPNILQINMTKAQANKLQAGDVLVHNPVFEMLQTKYLPPPDATPPLRIGKIYPSNFSLDSASENKKIYNHQDKTITLNFVQGKAVTIDIDNEIPLSMNYFILFKLKTQPMDFSPQTLFPFKKGLTGFVASDRNYFDNIEEVMLINFESRDFHYSRNIAKSLNIIDVVE